MFAQCHTGFILLEHFSELLFCNMTCYHPRQKPFVILMFEHYVSLPQFRSNLFVAVSLPGNSLIYLLYNFVSRTYNTLLAFINKSIVVLVCVLSCYVVSFAFLLCNTEQKNCFVNYCQASTNFSTVNNRCLYFFNSHYRW